MRNQAHDILRKYWGYNTFREKQEDIIMSILNGNDTLGLLPTGGGKSITFQVPALMLEGLTIVVTPLISLMKDQVDNLKQRGIKAALIHSGMKRREIDNAIDKCLYGKCKFLYISPERLSSERFIDNIRHMQVALLVVDEAHCISQWGYDFRPSYLNISAIRKLFPTINVLALTATATEEVIHDIMDKLQFRNDVVIKKSFRRGNIHYIVRQEEDKFQKLLSILNNSFGSAIVYVRSRAKTKKIAEELKSNGISAEYYHAGLSTEEKQDKQDKWKANKIRVIVATNAFGMGIDKPDVRVVVHIDVPNSIEEYYQEAGRAGRDEKKSYAVLIVSPRDKATLKRRISEAYPEKENITKIYERVCNFLEIGIGEGFEQLYEFNLNLFCTTFEYSPRIVHSALTILTQSKYLEFIEEVETQSRIMILVPKSELYDINGSNPTFDRILELILRNFTGLYSDYVFIDEFAISYRYDIPLQDIINALIFFNRQHVLHYIPRRRTPYIFMTSSRVDTKYVHYPKSVYEDGKHRLEKRINSRIYYSYNQKECREAVMLKYFAEDADNCNHCDVCIEKLRKRPSQTKDIQEGILYMLSLKPRKTTEFIETLSFPRQDIIHMLRFLLDEEYITYQNDTFSLASRK